MRMRYNARSILVFSLFKCEWEIPKRPVNDQSFAFGKAWAAVIEEYSNLGITHDTDILPALSGLAQHVEGHNPGQYIAGLWERDISYQLSWYRWNNPQGRNSSRCMDSPTFSWVAAEHTLVCRTAPLVNLCALSCLQLVNSQQAILMGIALIALYVLRVAEYEEISWTQR